MTHPWESINGADVCVAINKGYDGPLGFPVVKGTLAVCLRNATREQHRAVILTLTPSLTQAEADRQVARVALDQIVAYVVPRGMINPIVAVRAALEKP